MTRDEMQEWMRSQLSVNGSLYMDDYSADVEDDLVQILRRLGEDDVVALREQANIAVLWWRTDPEDWGDA